VKPSWDEYHLGIAKAVSLRSSCVRRKVGSVLVDPNNRIVSTGFNDSPPGLGNCFAGDCPRGKRSFHEIPSYTSYNNCIAIHAEVNCLDWWFVSRDLTAFPDGCRLYVTEVPCEGCWTVIKSYGIPDRNVIWPGKDSG
jgi:dCMP deaminase